MKLSGESRYGLEALIYLARLDPLRAATAEQIALATSLPPAFLAKILRRLAGAGVLSSSRGGATRGYALARPAEGVSVREVLECIEGGSIFERCIFWSDVCGAEPCPLHACWASVRESLAELMAETSLADVGTGRADECAAQLRLEQDHG